MMSAFELSGLDERAALELAKRRRDEALSKLHDARREFEDWDLIQQRARLFDGGRMFKELITAKEARQILDYDPAAGTFTWRKRTSGQFADTEGRSSSHACRIWNTRFSGGPAGNLQRSGYVVITLANSRTTAHRLAWLYVHGEWPTDQVDHINGNRSDNRIANLRLANHQQNQANSPRRSKKFSEFKGVYKYGNRWKAFIGLNRKTRYLGIFKTEAEAADAYRVAALEAFGEFAYRDADHSLVRSPFQRRV